MDDAGFFFAGIVSVRCMLWGGGGCIYISMLMLLEGRGSERGRGRFVFRRGGRGREGKVERWKGRELKWGEVLVGFGVLC